MCCCGRGAKQKHSDWDAYSRSKLLDLMAAQELNRRLYGAPNCRNIVNLALMVVTLGSSDHLLHFHMFEQHFGCGTSPELVQFEWYSGDDQAWARDWASLSVRTHSTSDAALQGRRWRASQCSPAWCARIFGTRTKPT